MLDANSNELSLARRRAASACSPSAVGGDIRERPDVYCGGGGRRIRPWLGGIGYGSGSYSDVDTTLRDRLFGDSRATIAGFTVERAGDFHQMAGKVPLGLGGGRISSRPLTKADVSDDEATGEVGLGPIGFQHHPRADELRAIHRISCQALHISKSYAGTQLTHGIGEEMHRVWRVIRIAITVLWVPLSVCGVFKCHADARGRAAGRQAAKLDLNSSPSSSIFVLHQPKGVNRPSPFIAGMTCAASM